ncbi:MAG: methyltransferase [Methyloceanibacter sp.]
MTDQAAFEDRLRKQIDAYHEAALVYAAVKLGLPDRLAAGPATGAQLAGTLELSAPHFTRFLRGLCGIGICEELEGGAFALTSGGQSLRSGSASRLAEKVQIVVGQYWWPWANFASSLETGKPAFEQCFGMSVFDWRARHEQQGALFDSYLAKETGAQLGAIVEVLDFSGVGTVAILQTFSHFAGAPLDRSRLVELSLPFKPLLDVAKRLEFVPGNLLDGIPVKADLYLLQGVLQQYDDADALTILRNCRAAMPDGARLAIIERLLPERAADDPAAIMLDLHMMTITGGRARSLAEFETLLAEAGLTLAKVTPTTSRLRIIQAGTA